jgi:DNA-binding transcriptional LysR family regulator
MEVDIEVPSLEVRQRLCSGRASSLCSFGMTLERPLDLRQVAYFVRVAELGSFTKAAVALDVAQSALSRHVAQLERAFGTRLLHRTGRGVVLTDEGQRAVRAMKALLDSAAQVERDLAAARVEPTGSVRLGILASLASVLLTPLLRRVHDRLGRVRMSVREGLSSHIEEWLEGGDVDLAILYAARPSPRASEQLLLTTDLYLLGAPGQSMTRRDTVAVAELGHVPMLLPALPNPHRALVEKVFRERDVPLNVAFELDSIQTMKDLAASGRNFTILPMHAACREVTAGYLMAARIVEPSIHRKVVLTSSPRGSKSAACRHVERLVVDTVASLVQSGLLPGRR